IPPIRGARVMRNTHTRKDSLIFRTRDQIANVSTEVEGQACRMRALHHFLIGMFSQIPAGKEHAGKAALRAARRQVDDRPLACAPLDALEHIAENVVVPAVDELRPNLLNVGNEAVAGQRWIARTLPDQNTQVLADALALLGRQAGVIEI